MSSQITGNSTVYSTELVGLITKETSELRIYLAMGPGEPSRTKCQQCRKRPHMMTSSSLRALYTSCTDVLIVPIYTYIYIHIKLQDVIKMWAILTELVSATTMMFSIAFAKWIFIFYHCKSENRDLFILRWWYHDCRWPVDGRGQGISNHGFVPFLPKYSSLGTREVKIFPLAINVYVNAFCTPVVSAQFRTNKDSGNLGDTGQCHKGQTTVPSNL